MVLLPICLQAQSSDLDSHISTIKQMFVDIDASAERCVDNELPDNPDCHAFSDALDREFLSQYLSHCEVLKSWRDELLTDTAAAGLDQDLGASIAQNLIDVEYSCGEDALLKRTEYVLTAYSRTRSPAYRNGVAGIQLGSSAQPGNSAAALSRSLLDSVRSQQYRLDREIQRQWQRIELENLRQQIDNRIDYGDNNH